MGPGELGLGQTVVARGQGPHPELELGLARRRQAGGQGLVHQGLLVRVRVHEPQGEHLQLGGAEHVVEALERGRWRNAVIEENIDDLLGLEPGAGGFADRQRKKGRCLGRGHEPVPGGQGVHECGVGGNGTLLAFGAVRIAGQALGKVVRERFGLAARAEHGLAVGHEQGRELARLFHGDGAQSPPQHRIVPQRGEIGPGFGRLGLFHPDQHPVVIEAGPQGGVVKDLAKGLENGLGVGLGQLEHRQPIGDHAAVGQPVAHEGEIFPGVEVDHPGHHGRWRFGRDDVELAARGQQEKPSVLHMGLHARVVQGIGAGLRVDDAAAVQDVPGDVDHVDGGEAFVLHQGAGRGACAVADEQGAFGVGQHRLGKIGEQLHVAQVGRLGRGHGIAVRNQAVGIRLAQVIPAQVLQGAGDALDGGFHDLALLAVVGHGPVEEVAGGAKGEKDQAGGKGDQGRQQEGAAQGRPGPVASGAQGGRHQIQGAQAVEALFHAERRQQEEAGHKRSDHGAQGVGHGQQAGGTGPVADFAVDGLAQGGEQQSRGQGGREHEGQRQQGDIAPIQTLVCAHRHVGHGPKDGERGQSGHGHGQGQRRGQFAAVGLACKPPAGPKAAQADAGQDHGQHHGKGQVGRAHEKLQKSRPDHFQGQKGATGQESGPEQPSGPAGQGRLRLGRCRGLGRGGEVAKARRKKQGPSRGREVEPGGQQSGAGQAQGGDAQGFAGQGAETRPQGVAAVEAAQGASEVSGAPGQGLDEQGQRHAHGRGRQEKQQKGKGKAQAVEQDRLGQDRLEHGAEPDRK